MPVAKKSPPSPAEKPASSAACPVTPQEPPAGCDCTASLPLACLTTLFVHTMEALVVTDTEPRIICVNRAFEEHTGYTAAEVLGKNPRILKSGHHDARFYQKLWQTIRSGHPWHEHVINRRADGSLINIEQVITPVFSEHGKISHYISVWRNVTREKELLEMARRSQRLEHLGQLATQIAHDFNNALTGVKGFSELLLAQTTSENDRPLIEEIIRSAHRAGALARQLLQLGQQRERGNASTDVNVIVTQMLQFLRNTLGEQIEVIFKPDWDVPPAAIDDLQLEQILLNLCVNARDAMPRGGAITLETTAAKTADSPQNAVALKVSDTGHGMTPEIQAHIFESFFTTKAEQGGSGLGLAIIKGILDEIGGSIRVDSEPGRGTTFELTLPAAVNRVPNERSTALPAPVSIPGSGTVLVVDPDPVLREVTREMLSYLGYTPVVAENSVEAFRSTQAIRLDAAIVAFDLPVLDGLRLIERLRELQPTLRFLLSSPSHRRLSVSGVPVLIKPYGISEISRAMHRLLNGESAAGAAPAAPGIHRDGVS